MARNEITVNVNAQALANYSHAWEDLALQAARVSYALESQIRFHAIIRAQRREIRAKFRALMLERFPELFTIEESPQETITRVMGAYRGPKL